jgi:hypothetical protein
MSYDKGKTIKEYMGGGYAQPMKYQTGGYIPGISRQLFGMGLRRDVATAQQEQIRQGKKLAKQEKRRGLFGKLGSLGGTALAAALAPATGGASLFLAKGLGSALGSFAGEKLAEGTTDTSGVGRKSSTGLLGSGFDRLKDMKTEAGEGVLGRSLATGVQTGLMAGGSDALRSFAGKNIPGVGKLLNQSAGIGEGQVVNAAGEVVPISTGAVTEAAKYTDQIMANTPINMSFSDVGGTDVLATDMIDEYGYLRSMNKGGKVYKYQQGGLMKAFKDADKNRDRILLGTSQRIADEDARDMQAASILRDLGEVNRAEQDIAMAQEGSANLAQRTQAGEGMQLTNQITDLLSTMQDGTERDLSMGVGGDSAFTQGVGMEEEGDNDLLNSLLGKTLGADAGGITSDSIKNILMDLAKGTQANIIREDDIINPKRLGLEMSYKRRGYAGGGLINMLPFNRRIM